jgi:transposase-like protein
LAEPCCKHCGSASFVRNGMASGHQRYRCKACGRNFTATPPRGKPPAMRALAVLLYGLGGVSQGMIAKLLGVSHVAVYKWVKAAGEAAPAPSTSPEDNIVQIDEMWHFVDGKKTRFGSGGPLTLWHGEPWPGSWVGVMTRPAADFSTRSASTDTSSSPTIGRASTGSSRRSGTSPART